MGMWSRYKKMLEDYDAEGSEDVDKVMHDEYSYLLRISLFYPKITPISVPLNIVLFIIYTFTLWAHSALLITSISKEEDFVRKVNLAHLGYIAGAIWLFTIIMFARREEMAICHKLLSFATFNYEETESDQLEEVRKMYISAKRLLKILLPSINVVGGTILVIVGPWIDSRVGAIEEGVYSDNGLNLVMPVHMWYPFEAHEGFMYWLAFFGQGFSSIIVAVMVASGTCAFCTIALHLLIELERLIISVQNIEERALNLYNEKYPNKTQTTMNETLYENPQYLECLEKCFIRNLKHHQHIKRYTKLTNSICKVALLISLFSCCLTLALSALITVKGINRPGSALGTLAMSLAEIGNPIVVCAVGQRITDLNLKFTNAMYSMPWYRCTKSFKTNLIIALENNVEDLYLTGAFNFRADLQTLSSLLNTSYSYFSLLMASESSQH